MFVDESGASTAMDRTHGRAPSGVRVDGPVPHGHWKITTLTAAVRLDGVPVSACLAFDGATDSVWLETYVERCLVPALRPDDIVLMDNLACHKTAQVTRLIEEAGATVRFLPAYSPDLNPIEKMFSKINAILRRWKARMFEALVAALGVALNAVRSSDIRGWFGHAGHRRALWVSTSKLAAQVVSPLLGRLKPLGWPLRKRGLGIARKPVLRGAS